MAKKMCKSNTLLYPVPVVMVSCRSSEGVNNIITVAWTGIVCSEPAMLHVSIRPERFSHGIIKNTGNFVVNIPNKGLTHAVDFCGIKSGRSVNKFEYLGLTAQKSNLIDVPFIGECPVNLECRVRDIIALGSHDMFIAEILCVNIEEWLMDKSEKPDFNKADLICYNSGEYRLLAESLGKFGFSAEKK
ncbi:MAG TPA: flavin reductase family protein [Bacillota bacterium]|nr:flavin reductase family protein [Bacillota bacterium]